eukprot:3166226-Amphidinium_carterae.1
MFVFVFSPASSSSSDTAAPQYYFCSAWNASSSLHTQLSLSMRYPINHVSSSATVSTTSPSSRGVPIHVCGNHCLLLLKARGSPSLQG